LTEKYLLEFLVTLLRSKNILSLIKLLLYSMLCVIKRWFRQNYCLSLLPKPRVTQNFLYSFERPYTVIRIFGKEAFDQRFDLLSHSWSFWKLWFRMENSIENIFFFGCVEGRPSEEKFVQKNSKGVKINLVRVSRSE